MRAQTSGRILREGQATEGVQTEIVSLQNTMTRVSVQMKNILESKKPLFQAASLEVL